MTSIVPRLVLLVLALAGPAAGQVTEIEPGQVYQAGTRVGVASFGVSFVIPQDWMGSNPQGTEVFMMRSNTRAGLILVVGDQVDSVDDAVGLLNEPLDIDGTNFLRPVDEPVVLDGEITQTYSATIQGQELTGEAHAFVTGEGIGLAYVAIGPVDQSDYYRALATELAESTELTTPVAEPTGAAGSDGGWDQMLRGRKLHYIASSTGYSNEEQIDLCMNGSFASRGGGGAIGGLVSGAWQDGGSGLWTITNGELLLTYGNGEVASYELSLDGTKLLLNGYRYFRVATDSCA